MAPASPLEALVREELFGARQGTGEAGDVAAAAEAVAREVRQRLGSAVAAVVFYGSCLRKATAEGVLDLYVVVDDYRAAYGAGPLAVANRLLPPNVFYVETRASGGAVLRAKYAVVSRRDLLRAAGESAIRPALWARFCQPIRPVGVRDDEARELLVHAVTRSIRTAVRRGLGLTARGPETWCVEAEAFWQTLFRETYASELRPEREENVRALYRAAPGRYAAVLRACLDTLEAEGALRVEEEVADGAGSWRLAGGAALRGRPQRGRRRLAKAIGGVALLKSAVTFGDWLPYALWKLERHTGTRIEPSERQRRHPLLFAWPLVLRALASRDLR